MIPPASTLMSPDDLAVLTRCAASPEALAELLALFERHHQNLLPTAGSLMLQVLRVVPLNVVLCDRDGRMLLLSPAIPEMLGVSMDDLLGHKYDELPFIDMNTPGGDRVREQFAAALDGHASTAELEQMWEPLPPRTLEYSVTPVTAVDGSVTHVLFTVRDLTENTEVVRTLKATERYYRALIHSLPATSVLMFDHDLRYLLVEGDDAFKRHGYDPDFMRGRTLSEVLPPERRGFVEPLYRKTLAGEDSTTEFERDGVIYRTRFLPVRGDSGEVIAGMAVNEDITADRRAEEALRLSEQRFRALARSIPHSSLLVFDHELRYVIVEGADIFERHGFDTGAMLGRTLYDVITLPHRHEYLEMLYRATLEGQELKVEFEKDGHIYLTHFFPIYDESGDILYGTALNEDVTEARRAAEKLRESELRFEQAFAHSPLGMSLVGLDFKIISSNTAASAMLGYTPREMAALTVEDVSFPGDLHPDLELRDRLIAGEIDHYQLEKRYRHKDGSTRWGSLHVALVRSDDGTPLYLVSQVDDITERKRMQVELQEAKARFEQAFVISPIGTALVGLDLRFFEVNDSLCRMLGYSPDELKTLTVTQVTHPEDMPATTDFAQRLLAGEIDRFQQEKRYLHQDGRVIWGMLNVALIRSDAGAPLYFVSKIEDITERKQMFTELQEAKARFEQAFENSVLGMAMTAPTLRFITTNASLQRMLGYSAEELNGMLVADVSYPDDMPENKRLSAQLFRGEINQFSMEKRYFHRDGRVLWGRLSVGVVRGEDGQPKYQVAQIEDITERKRMESDLHESEQRFQRAFANSPMGMVLVTPDGRFFESNTSFQRMLGYSAAEIRSLDVDIITYTGDITADHAHMQRLLAGESDHYRMEKRYMRRDGQILWVVLTAALVRDNNGTPLYFVSQVEDISERRKTEAALRESEQRFQRAFENSPIGMALITPDYRVTSVNRAFQQMVGYSQEELLGKTAHDLTYPGDIAIDDDYKRRLLAGEIAFYRMEKRYLHKKGYIIWSMLTESIIRDSDGQPLYLVAQIEDITERKRMITELHESRERYENLVSSIPGIVYQLRRSPEGWLSFDYISPRIYEMVGLTAGAIMADATTLYALVDPEYRASLFEAQDTSRHTLEPFVWEGAFIVNGERVFYHIESRPRQLLDGTTIWSGIGVDVTARRQLHEALMEQESLRVSLQKAREVSELKSNMMMHISHEFRTPLAIIQSSSELLDRYGDRMTEDKRRDHMTRVYEEVHHLASILDELSMLTNGGGWGGINPMLINLEEVCQRVIERTQRASHNSHPIHTAQSARLPAMVNLDPRLVETMLSKLLLNAVKFSPPGSPVEIALDASAHEVIIDVRDYGIGIPEADMKRLFEPFFKGSNNELPSGVGLGLSIVRDAVLLHGGTIRVKSTVDQGTTFTIRLPQQMA